MNMLTLSKHFFTSFFHISRLAKKKKETKKKFVETVAVCRVSLDYNLCIAKKQLFRIYLPVKLVYGKMSIKKRKSYRFSYPFFFLSGFSFANIHDSPDSRGRGRASI